MPGAEVIAYHGWGFDASCWEGWSRLFGEKVMFQRFERGYFSPVKKLPIFSDQNRPNIIFAHSFGLHHCPPEQIRQADLLVIFGGFLYFHPRTAQFKRRSRMALNQMINRLESNPGAVLKEFYKNTFYPQRPWKLPKGEPDQQKLLNDLQALNTHEISPELLKSVNKMCILHGFEDTIVPRTKGRELYDVFQDCAKYLEVKNAGHALPFTHSEQCWQFIEPEIKELIYR